jgi:hypothetical protein
MMEHVVWKPPLRFLVVCQPPLAEVLPTKVQALLHF